MGTAPGTDVMPPLDPAQLAVGDQLYDTRRKLEMTVTALKPCGGCACGHGDISVREDHDDGPRRRTWSFAQFRKLKSLVREPAMGQLRYDDDLGWLIDAHPVRSGDAVLVRARATFCNVSCSSAAVIVDRLATATAPSSFVVFAILPIGPPFVVLSCRLCCLSSLLHHSHHPAIGLQGGHQRPVVIVVCRRRRTVFSIGRLAAPPGHQVVAPSVGH